MDWHVEHLRSSDSHLQPEDYSSTTNADVRSDEIGEGPTEGRRSNRALTDAGSAL